MSYERSKTTTHGRISYAISTDDELDIVGLMEAVILEEISPQQSSHKSLKTKDANEALAKRRRDIEQRRELEGMENGTVSICRGQVPTSSMAGTMKLGGGSRW